MIDSAYNSSCYLVVEEYDDDNNNDDDDDDNYHEDNDCDSDSDDDCDDDDDSVSDAVDDDDERYTMMFYSYSINIISTSCMIHSGISLHFPSSMPLFSALHIHIP